MNKDLIHIVFDLESTCWEDGVLEMTIKVRWFNCLRMQRI
jgi:hypothetical protein